MALASIDIAIAVGAVIGAVGGGLIVLARSRTSTQEEPQVRPLDDQSRLAFRVFMVVFAVVALCLIAVAVVAEGVVAVLPFAVLLIVAAIALARVWSART